MPKLKISYPTYQVPARTTFGRGSLRTLAADGMVRETVFFLSGEAGVAALFAAALAKEGLVVEDLDCLRKPAGEPATAMLALGAEFLARRRYRRIVAVGGGSTLDWARLSWAHERGFLRLTSTRAAMEPPAPHREAQLWLVPTTCGTGAEAASVVVLSHEGRKLPVVSPAFLADQVLLDSQFLDRLTPSDLAASLCDALSHGIESYVSIVPGRLAREAAIASLRTILKEFPAPPSRCRLDRLLEAGYLGGIAASNCSVGAVHAFAHTVAAYGFSHRIANALGLRAGLAANSAESATHELAAELGLPSTTDLVVRVDAIRHAAITPADAVRARALLGDRTRRSEVATRMLEDVCLRTNPARLGPPEVERFLSDVLGSLP